MTLDNGARLPEIAAKTRDGEATTINALIADSWAVALFYRGHW